MPEKERDAVESLDLCLILDDSRERLVEGLERL
jgi:hypothetical protein